MEPDKGNPNVFTTFKGRFHLETATVGVWGTNLVTNGDFSDGTTGWVGLNTTLSTSDNMLIGTVTARDTTNYNMGIYQSSAQLNNLNTAHKYYIAMSVDSNMAGTFDVRYGFSSQDIASGTLVKGSFTHLSKIVIPSATSKVIRCYFGWGSSVVVGEKLYVKNIICIDLTAAFGAGNEPTAEQMDAYLARYPNSWFDGSALLTPSYTVDSDVVMLSCTNDVQPIGDWTLNDYTANSPFSTLPSECRPLKTLKIPVVVNDGVDRIVVLTVNTDGTMSLPFDYATATLFISGVNFNISGNWY